VDADGQGVGTVTEPRLHQPTRRPRPIADRPFEIELSSGRGTSAFTFGRSTGNVISEADNHDGHRSLNGIVMDLSQISRAAITGISSGIGAVYPYRLARRDHVPVPVARNRDRLDALTE
jgi:hypothetical protein